MNDRIGLSACVFLLLVGWQLVTRISLGQANVRIIDGLFMPHTIEAGGFEMRRVITGI